MLKYGCGLFTYFLYELFSMCVKSVVVPGIWESVIIIPYTKKMIARINIKAAGGLRIPGNGNHRTVIKRV